MTSRPMGWVGWMIATVCVGGLTLASAIFLRADASIDSGIALNIAFLAFPLVGIGTTFTSFSASFISYALVHHLDAQLTTRLIDIFGDLVWPANLVLGVFILYVFPDGRALSRRLSAVCWALGLTLLLVEVGQAVTPGPLESHNRVPNPLGVHALAGFASFIIDILIKRTLVYGTLAAILVGPYFGLVVGASLRNEVDLAQLNEHLLGVVDETMRPTHASLWLRSPAYASTSRAQEGKPR